LDENAVLKNQELFKRLRNKAFTTAEELIDNMVENFERLKSADPLMEKLTSQLEEIVCTLEDARYFARLSVGGDNTNPPPQINDEERIFVDLVEMCYSYARSIRRITRHESVILNHIALRDNINPLIVDYLLEIRKADEDLIAKNMTNLQQRLKLYRRHLGEITDRQGVPI
jgi:hypothetical protein